MVWVRYVIILILGIGVGVFASKYFADEKYSSVADSPQRTGEVTLQDLAYPESSQTVVESSTQNHDAFGAFDTIADMLELPTDYGETAALYMASAQAGEDKTMELIDEAMGLTDHNDRNAALSILFGRLVEINPQRALEMSLSHPYKNVRNLQWRIWYEWSRSDFEAALAAATILNQPNEKVRAARSIYQAVGLSDPNRVQTITEQFGIAPDRSAYSQHLNSLLLKSPDVALNFIVDAVPAQHQASLIRKFAHTLATDSDQLAESYASLVPEQYLDIYTTTRHGVLAKTNPRAYLQNIAINQATTPRENQNKQHNYVSSALITLSATNFDEAMQFWQSLNNSRSQAQSLVGIFGSELLNGNPEEVLSYASQLNRIDKQFAIAQMINLASEKDIEHAFQLVNSLPSDQPKERYLANIISNLATTDVDAARLQLENLRDPSMREQVQESILSVISANDPVLGIEYLVENQSDFDSSNAWNAIASTRDVPFESLLQYSKQIRDSNLRNQLLSANLLEGYGSQQISRSELMKTMRTFDDIEGGRELQTDLLLYISDEKFTTDFLSEMPPSSHRDKLITEMALIGSYDDGASIDAMFNLIDNPQKQSEFMQKNLSMVAQEDFAAPARQWIEMMDDPTLKAKATIMYLDHRTEISNGDLDLITQIDDPQFQTQLTKRAIYKSAAADPDRAIELLRRSDLSSQQRQSIRDNIEQCASTNDSLDQTCMALYINGF